MPSMPKIPRSQNRTPSWRLRMNGSPHLRVTSPGIAEDERFLLAHTGRGDDVSPELRINGLTDDVARLAVVLTDETHPLLGSMTHWLIWNLPAQSVIEAGLPSGRITRDGAVQGRGYGLHRYRGPKPPRGTSHRYSFLVLALDAPLSCPARAGTRRFWRSAAGHILQWGVLEGVFE